MHGSRGHIGNWKNRALASDFKKPMNSFFLSFFLSFVICKMPCKAKASIYATYQFSFSPVHETSALHWSEHVYWVSPLQLPLSLPFPCTTAAAGRMSMRVEKQSTHERERERLHQGVYSDSDRLLPAAKHVGIYRDTAQ
jgi:hypothetical protein